MSAQDGNLLQTVSRAAYMLLRPECDDFTENLQRCMGIIGEAVNAARVCIWKNHTVEGRLKIARFCEWPGGADSEQSTGYKEYISYSGMAPGWEQTLSHGECIAGASAFAAPIFVQDQFWGFVGYDNCGNGRLFSGGEAAFLHSGSLLIASALTQAALDDAKRANDAKSSFLANMSHEMRTPLNAVIGLTELTLENQSLDGESFSNIEKVHNAGMTLLGTVNDILDISKIEAGKFKIIPAVYDMPSLINDTVTQSIMHKGEKPIRFTLNINGDLPAQLNGDELRVKQVLNNLLSNAFKYTKEGAVEFGIECAREGDTVLMTAHVWDTGMGIRPENIDSIFDDYLQVNMRANRKIMGTGLGLSITKRMVELMNGTVNVVSELGKGSIFIVRLPQKYVSDEVIGPEMAENLKKFQYIEQKYQQNSKRVRIRLPYARVLIVDDMAANLDVAKGLMKPYGMQIDCAASGQQAIDAISDEKVRYNAVFMDHMMPGMDGIEAVRRIREIGTDYARAIPIIALTANAVVGNEEMFLDKGFQAFISKPIELARLDVIIREWIRDKEQEKEQGKNAPVIRRDSERRAVCNRRSGFDRRKFGNLYYELNVNKGIERFGGDREVYLDILQSFAADTGLQLKKLEDVNGDNLDDYAIAVHGIKGSCRGILAEAVGNKAEALEKAAKAGDLNFVREHNPEFLKTAGKLVEDITDILKKIGGEEVKPKKGKPNREILARLLAACQKYDMDEADAALSELERYSYESDDGLITWLRINVDEADFAHIIEKLSYLDR